MMLPGMPGRATLVVRSTLRMTERMGMVVGGRVQSNGSSVSVPLTDVTTAVGLGPNVGSVL